MKKLLVLSLFILLGVFLVSCDGCNKKVEELSLDNYSKYLTFNYTVENVDNKYLYRFDIATTNDKYVFKNVYFRIYAPAVTNRDKLLLPENGNFSGSFVDSKLDNIYIWEISGDVFKWIN